MGGERPRFGGPNLYWVALRRYGLDGDSAGGIKPCLNLVHHGQDHVAPSEPERHVGALTAPARTTRFFGSPTETERVPGRVRIDLEASGGVNVRTRLRADRASPQSKREIVSRRDVVDRKVHVDLLLDAVRPDRLDVIGRVPDSDQRQALSA